mgnify:CR=1 FL=1
MTATGKIARGYEYWEKGYLGKGSAAFDPTTDESWEERWVAGSLDRINAKLAELEAMGVREVVARVHVGARAVVAVEVDAHTKRDVVRGIVDDEVLGEAEVGVGAVANRRVADDVVGVEAGVPAAARGGSRRRYPESRPRDRRTRLRRP